MRLITTLNNIYKVLKDLYEVADNADRTLTKIKSGLDRLENRQVMITIPAIKAYARMLNKEQDAKKETPKEVPAETAPMHRHRWTSKDITLLCQMYNERKSFKEISATLGRSIQSINSKVRDLNIARHRSNE